MWNKSKEEQDIYINVLEYILFTSKYYYFISLGLDKKKEKSLFFVKIDFAI